MRRLLKQALLRRKFQALRYASMGAVLLAGLITPATPASAGTLAWSPITTPGMQSGQFMTNSNIDIFVIAPNSIIMLVYDNGTKLLNKSENGGLGWTTSDIGNGLEGNVVTDIAISPNYAADSTVVAATSKKVYRSIDGGKNFYDITLTLSLSLGPPAEVITSIDYSPWHLGSQTIIIGTSNGALGGHVYLLSGLSSAWTDLLIGNWSSPKVACDVLALAFSPNNQSDNGIMAVVTHSGGTMLTNKYGSNAWGSNIYNANISTQQAATATMAFPTNFDWSSSHNVFVGTSGTTDDDVFLVSIDITGTTFYIYDQNVSGTTETEVNSIAVKGVSYQAQVLVGQKSSPVVLYGTAYYGWGYWYTSSKSPTGSANTIVAWSPTSENAYAATSDTGLNRSSALSRSSDYGANWNQISMISISNPLRLAITDVAAVDEKTIFFLMWDDADNSLTYSRNDYTMLFKTTDSGITWERVWVHRTVATEAITNIKLSPAYATDNTLLIAQNDSAIWQTSDGCTSFSGLNAPATVTAIGVVNQNTYYTGHNNAIYKNNRWIPATLANETAKSIVITPEGTTVFVGTNNGNVFMSTDDAKTFTLLGTSESLGANADIIVTLDANYASTKTIFAVSPNLGAGINRWVVGQSNVWKQIDPADSMRSYTDLAVSSEGVLYAASNTADKGLRRIVSPNAEQTNINPESVTIDLPTGAKLNKLVVLTGSNTILAVASNITVVPGEYYGYRYRVLSFSDILVVSPELTKPADKAVISETFTLTWKQIEFPFVFTYRYQVATDADFNNKILDGTTTGSAVNVTNLRLGGQFWWRVYVEKVGDTPLRSKTSAIRTFNVELPEAVIKSPGYGAIDVSLRPTFSWVLVPGATSYDIELSDNLNYDNAWVQKDLDHTVWTWEKDLKYSTSYYWRVRAVVSRNIVSSNPGRWSEAVFTTKAKPTVSPPPVIVDTLKPSSPPVINLPAIVVDIPATPAPPPSNISSFHIRIIIVIYSVLFLAIIALIVISRGIRLF